jgi:hypothetical protein
LIWSTLGQDRAKALRIADALVRDLIGNESMRLQTRWAAAITAQGLGDLDRARADFAALERECAGQPAYQGLIEDVRRRLQALASR